MKLSSLWILWSFFVIDASGSAEHTFVVEAVENGIFAENGVLTNSIRWANYAQSGGTDPDWFVGC